MAVREEWVKFYVTLKTSELRRRQTLCHLQQRRAFELVQHADTRDRGERAATELQDMDDSLTEAVMQKEFPDVRVR